MAYKQAQNRKKRLLKTYNATKHGYGAGVWLDDCTGCYRKYHACRTSGYTKYLRRLSNRKVRKSKDIYNYGAYRKLYDYWWTLF